MLSVGFACPRSLVARGLDVGSCAVGFWDGLGQLRSNIGSLSNNYFPIFGSLNDVVGVDGIVAASVPPH